MNEDPISVALAHIADSRTGVRAGRRPSWTGVFQKDDLRIDTYTNSSKTQWVRVTHIPTGVVASGSGLRSEDLEAHMIRVVEQMLVERDLLIQECLDKT